MSSPERLPGSVLVRGATGFLGGSVACALAGRVDRLRLFVRRPERLAPALLESRDVEVVAGDVLDRAAVARSLAGVDRVIETYGASHPAATPDDPAAEIEYQLRPLAILLGEIGRGTPAALFYPSSGGAVYGDVAAEPVTEEAPLRPESAYGLGKQLGEKMIRYAARRGQLRYVIARTANVYGGSAAGGGSRSVVDLSLERIRAGRKLECWGDGAQARDFLFVDDFVAATLALLALDADALTVNVSTGRGTTLRRLFEIVSEVTGVAAEIAPRPAAYVGVANSVLSPARLAALTGWLPRWNVEEGVAEAWRRLSEPVISKLGTTLGATLGPAACGAADQPR